MPLLHLAVEDFSEDSEPWEEVTPAVEEDDEIPSWEEEDDLAEVL